MLDRDEFVALLTAANSSLWLARSTWLHTQSLMVPLVNAIRTYDQNPSSANLLAVIHEIGRVPPSRKQKYVNALQRLCASIGQSIRVRVAGGGVFTLHLQGLGIEILYNAAANFTAQSLGHQINAVFALEQLNALPTGSQLLQNICNELNNNNNNRVTIAHSREGNFVRGNAQHPEYGRTPLIDALVNTRGQAAAEITAAMTAAGHPPNTAGSYPWLAEEINETPIYQRRGAPSTRPSHRVHGNDWISPVVLQAWLAPANQLGHLQFPRGLPSNQMQADAILVLGTVLHPHARHNNIICSPAVFWNAHRERSATGPRPPYIGLGHELIHALHYLRGEQPGFDTDQHTGVLFEYLCVGLGRFDDEPISENTLRADAHLERRALYEP